MPASATQPQGEAAKDRVKIVKEKSTTQEKAEKKMSAGAQGDVEKAQASANKAKADVKADVKPTAKGTHHKASKMGATNTEAGKAKVDVNDDAASSFQIQSPTQSAS